MKGKEILQEVQHLINDPAYSRFNEINRAYRSLCRTTKFNWLRGSSDNLLALKSDDASYEISVPFVRVLTHIWVKESTGQLRFRLMEEVPIQLYEEKVDDARGSDGTETTNIPKFYKIEGTGQTMFITVSPTPDQDYDTRINYIKYEETIGREEIPSMPVAYHDLIAQLAASYILETSSDQAKMLHAQRLQQRVGADIINLVGDSHPNRTINIDRVEGVWLR